MADDLIRYDAVTVHNRAQLTPEGFLRDSPVIGRSGVQEYRRADGSLRREYRPPEVIFAAQSLAAVAGIPIIDRHSALINSQNVRQHIVGSVMGAARQDSANPNHMVGDIVIYDPTPVTKGGRKELSLCYGVLCDETPGTTPDGQPYDARVTTITRYDHLAIVEKGRAGVAKLRLDDTDAVATDLNDIEILPRDDNMAGDNEPNPGGTPTNSPPATTPPATTAAPGTVKMTILRLDSVEYEVPPQVERGFVKAQEAVAAANLRADAAEAARDTLQAQIDAHAAQLTQARADGAVAARIRLQLEANAREHGVEFRSDSTDRGIREAVIRKINNKPDTRFDDKSDEYITFAFDAALDRAAEAARNNKQNRITVNGGGSGVPVRADGVTQPLPGPGGVTLITSAKQARDLMGARMRASGF